MSDATEAIFARGTVDEVMAEIRRRLDDVPDVPGAARHNELQDIVVALVGGIRAREEWRTKLKAVADVLECDWREDMPACAKSMRDEYHDLIDETVATMSVMTAAGAPEVNPTDEMEGLTLDQRAKWLVERWRESHENSGFWGRAAAQKQNELGTLKLQVDALRDRIATIASEAFGPFPVQSDDENLTAIERGIFETSRDLARLTTFADKVDAIRNDIVARQSIGWSQHVYPLVAALDEAGLKGEGYDAGRARLVTERDRIDELEAEVAALRKQLAQAGLA